ncbi:hypothetical protein [Pseudomonas sp.]|uniref:hypothetical protein n=1 Tax=Pseudomonas sp. TaxID=306 RepID=UPI003A9792EC
MKFISWAYEEKIKEAEDKRLLQLYLNLDSGSYKTIALRASQSLEKYIDDQLDGSLTSFKGIRLIFYITFIFSLSVFLHFRAIDTGSLTLAIDNLANTSIGVLFFSLFAINFIIAIISTKITESNIRKAASAHSNRVIAKHLALDAIAAYLLISASVYLSSALTIPILELHKTKSLETAYETLLIFASFEHWNSLTWIFEAPMKIGGMSNVDYALISFIPTLVFLAIILASLISFLALKIFKTPLMNISLRYFDSKEKNISTVLGASLLVVAALLMYFLRTLIPAGHV